MLPLLFLIACGDGLSAFSDNGPLDTGADNIDTGTAVTTETTATGTGTTTTGTGTTATGTGTTTTGTTTGATTTSTTTSTTTTTTGGATLNDGHYSGTVTVYFNLTFPPITSTCTGDVDIVVDASASPQIQGTLSDCDWPILDLLAQLTLGTVNGTIDGSASGSAISGNSIGSEPEGFVTWDQGYSGTVAAGPVMGATFNSGFAIIGYQEVTVTAAWTGPL